MLRILGIDYGSKRVGLALSDPTHLIASPFKTLTVSSDESLIYALQKIIQYYKIESVVIGMPYRLKGGDSPQTKVVRKFTQKLMDNGIRVEEEDERLSSVSAKRALIDQNFKTGKNKGLIDQTAAAIMLQQYLDKKRRA
jgi:putative Holliday junction resolvase